MGTGAATRSGAARLTLAGLHTVAVLLVVAGVVAQVMRPVAPPIADIPEATRWFDSAHLARVHAYWTPRYAMGLVTLGLRVAVPVLVAATPVGRRAVARVVARVGIERPVRAAVAVALAITIGVDLLLAPIAFWAGYLHETAYGFRTTGVGGWLYDWVAARAPGWVGIVVLVGGGYAIARRLPRDWPVVAALLGAAGTAFVVLVGPYVLEPLRFRTTPLPHGPLREEIEAVAGAAGLPVDRILVADASRRTTRHNAYVSGLGATRRIVLYDTLVAERPVDEVAMVVAHELGHERHGDLGRGTLAGMAGVVVTVYGLGWIQRRRVRSGGLASVTDPRGVAALVALVAVLNAASLPGLSAMSRRAEAAADLAGLEITRDPATFLRMNLELARTNLSDPDPPAWVHVLWYSHPPTVARLTMGERWPFETGESVSAGPGRG
jgi:STE24 endopeptidase